VKAGQTTLKPLIEGQKQYRVPIFSQSGVSGPTRSLPTRQDALTAAAHAVMRHCQRLITSAAGQPRADVRAAKEVIRWLELLDLF
jgi:hypothetical protein